MKKLSTVFFILVSITVAYFLYSASVVLVSQLPSGSEIQSKTWNNDQQPDTAEGLKLYAHDIYSHPLFSERAENGLFTPDAMDLHGEWLRINAILITEYLEWEALKDREAFHGLDEEYLKVLLLKHPDPAKIVDFYFWRNFKNPPAQKFIGEYLMAMPPVKNSELNYLIGYLHEEGVYLPRDTEIAMSNYLQAVGVIPESPRRIASIFYEIDMHYEAYIWQIVARFMEASKRIKPLDCLSPKDQLSAEHEAQAIITKLQEQSFDQEEKQAWLRLLQDATVVKKMRRHQRSDTLVL